MKKYILILLITNQFLWAQISPSFHGILSKIHERPKPTNSIYFDGINQQYLQISNSGLNFNAASDFTFETWVKFTTFNYSGQRYAPIFGGNQYNYISVDGQKVYNRINASAVCSGDHVLSGILQTNKWYHIAVVRESGTIKGYVDGIYQANWVCSAGTFFKSNASSSDANINIGAALAWNTSYLNGYISNMRYVVGTALYTSNFTPSTSLAAAPGTVLLLNVASPSTVFDDSSGNNLIVTPHGSASVFPTFVVN